MSEAQETLAGIVAEIRQLANTAADGVIAIKGEQIADRIEAAARRDYEYPKAQSLDADKLTGKNISGLVTDLRQIAKYHYARGNIEQGQFARVMADRIEGAKVGQMYAMCSIISYLVRNSRLLKESDERNGKPYKLFGSPLTYVYGRLACKLYRAADIDRKFWLSYLKETDSDPKGMDKHLHRIFPRRICRIPLTASETRLS